MSIPLCKVGNMELCLFAIYLRKEHRQTIKEMFCLAACHLVPSWFSYLTYFPKIICSYYWRTFIFPSCLQVELKGYWESWPQWFSWENRLTRCDNKVNTGANAFICCLSQTQSQSGALIPSEDDKCFLPVFPTEQTLFDRH